ncbi:hypothetical protein GYMLUDRAFT_46378 [Collybiopsis luxurians FD-317 M1]|uniref:Uncharacterized protein n=1 Tax=Collybiopsis luxurians FD-317 M1 TaxID=944289 RepID=A0A0D0BPY8_9AGAR|nr:hypothetical protein GYMLUDRAFT_46378 [Collybiopsis luxurians FD-317 M1]
MLSFTISLCLFFSVVRALPTLLSRDVVDPPITSPTASTVWHSGETVTVTWDTSNINASTLTNPNGEVVLGWMANPTDSEHLMLNPPLAQNFPLIAGNVTFTVPSVVTRTNYIVVLFGDSGNISPTFTILGTDASSSAQPTTSSVTAPTTAPTASASTASSPASAPGSTHSQSEVIVTNTQTSVITASSNSSPTISGSAVSPSATTPSTSSNSDSLNNSSATGASSSSSSSASAAAASTNAAWKASAHQSQAFALVAAGLLAAYLL